MKALLSISLFLAVIAPGEPLRCNTCGSQFFYPTSCQTETSQYCKANQKICMSGVLSTNMIANKMILKFAACKATGAVIPGDYSLTSENNHYLHFLADSCNTDNCNPVPQVPVHMELPSNGLQCPACFANGTRNCESRNTVNCFQNETMCIDFAGKLSTFRYGSNDVTLKGCATKDFCRLAKGANKLLEHRLTVNVYRIGCVDAQESPSDLSSAE